MADAVMMLRQEIGRLEQEIAKRRTALRLLTGARAATKSAATKKAAPTPPAAPRAAKTVAAAGPSLAKRIVAYLTTNKGKLYSPVQVTEALAKTDKTVTRENVQRRLGELVTAKKLKRVEGQYGAV